MCDTFHVAKVAATLPGYASVARAADVLHLAPRSVRSLIYAGRLASLRVGRLHYIRSADLEAERRRRLGLPLREVSGRARSQPHRRQAPRSEAAPVRRHADPEVRRQRAAERAELVKHWAQRHEIFEPHVPAAVREVETPIACAACSRQVRRGRYVELTTHPGISESLCVTCARRALLEWADRRRLEAAAARRLSQSLGEPEPRPMLQPHLLVA
jgi:hypothetical protein